tara:strand:+ start:333 stop:581 length:249 start_codon:yes stop_codon:yes gene_type:complete
LLTPPNDGTQKENKLDLRVAPKKGAGHWDTVEVDNSSYANANALIASLSQQGDDVVLNDNGTTIRFENTTIAAFDTDMFVFV